MKLRLKLKGKAKQAPEPTAIGRLGIVGWNDRKWVVNVLDVKAGTNTPKRVRIQQHPHLVGKVLQPSEYEFEKWL